MQKWTRLLGQPVPFRDDTAGGTLCRYPGGEIWNPHRLHHRSSNFIYRYVVVTVVVVVVVVVVLVVVVVGVVGGGAVLAVLS